MQEPRCRPAVPTSFAGCEARGWQGHTAQVWGHGRPCPGRESGAQAAAGSTTQGPADVRGSPGAGGLAGCLLLLLPTE